MSDKISKEAVLYYPPAAIGEKTGARCGTCMFYITNHKCLVVHGDIDGFKGICGLFVNGAPQRTGMAGGLPKAYADYTENGPTHCGNCEYYGGGQKLDGDCGKVQGRVMYHGCCNAWEKAPSA